MGLNWRWWLLWSFPARLDPDPEPSRALKLDPWGLRHGGWICHGADLIARLLELWSKLRTKLTSAGALRLCDRLFIFLSLHRISLVCPSSSSFAGRFLLDSSFWPFSLATNTPRGALNGSENHVPKIPRWENLQKCRLYNFLNLVMLATILTHVQSISICHYLPMSVYLNGWTTSPGREIPFFSIWLLPWHWLLWSLPGFWTAAAILADWSHLRYILLLIG